MNEMNSLYPIAYFACPQLSFSTRRRFRRRRHRRLRKTNDNNNNYNYNPLTKSSSLDYENINLVLDFHQISVLSSTKSKFHRFLSSAEQAYTDLRTVIKLDDNGRLILSCRKSTLQFVGSVLLSGLVLVFFFRVLFKLGLGLGFRSHLGAKKQNVLVRRDRSLGGREVVVAVETRDDPRLSRNFINDLYNPLSEGRVTGSGSPGQDRRNYRFQKSRGKLPKWWPVQVAADQNPVVDKEEFQRQANIIIRVIIDRRTSGQDVMEDDIIQLRRICRISGVRVSIDTINTRDSLYRTSVDFVLNSCCRARSDSTYIQIDGEDAREFIAGLANNIGLENIRAARMVSAAVAARTRSYFLQAWALEMQGNHSEALLELLKICRVFQLFPPEESAPEMEMVARGLEKLLKFEQRKILMNMLVGICSEETHRSAAEALGLLHVHPHEGNTEDQDEESTVGC